MSRVGEFGRGGKGLGSRSVEGGGFLDDPPDDPLERGVPYREGVETGRLDAEWLLSAALGVDRLQLYLQYDRPLSPEEREAFKPLLRRRAAAKPLQYIIGRTGFRQLE